jgi:S1-C subfamily serine protease
MCHLRNWILSGAAMCAMAAFGAAVACGQTNSTRAGGQNATNPAAAPQTFAPQQNPPQTATNQAGGIQRQAKQADNPLGAKLEARGSQGLVVGSVEPNEAAARAGLEANDRIVAVDGRPFASQRHLDAYLSSQPGRQVPFLIERNGRQFILPVIPAEVSGTVSP